MKKETMSMKKRALKLAGRGLLVAFATGMVSLASGGLISQACTSYYAGKEVTTDGSILFGRTEDIGTAYNKIFIVEPAASHAPGEMYEDGTGFTMPYPAETYRFTACEDDPAHGDGPFGETGTNQYGVSMSATESASPSTTIRAVDPFIGGTGITESSMVNAVLPCVKTAREGIEFLADILDTYGAGEGNTLMIGDKDECWYMEILTGHQYVAIKMPEDKAALLPNCFMLEEVDLSDTENVIASENLIQTAETAGTLVTGEGKNTIHVRKSYAGAMGEGNSYRIWGGQIIFNDSLIESINPTDTDLPMFVTPNKEVSVKTMYQIAGSQYEGTEYEGQRVIGSARSVECHTFQIRDNMPTELATLQWMCMASADMSTYIPYYSAAITDTHPAYQVENLNYDEDSAYWTFRSLATLGAANRELAGVNIKAYWSGYMDDLITRQTAVDTKMMDLYSTDSAAVSEKATNLGMAVADETISAAKGIYSELMTALARQSGTLIRDFIPSALTNNIYSTYSFDSTYVDSEAELKKAQAEAEAAKKAETAAKLEAEAAKKAETAAKLEVEAAKKALEELRSSQTETTKTLTINKKKITLKKGRKAVIKVSASPSSKITFKSSNKKIATVSSKGIVKGKKAGIVTITIKANGLRKTVKVTVKK